MDLLKKLEETVVSLVGLATDDTAAKKKAEELLLPEDERPCIDGRKEPRERKPLDLSKCKGYNLDKVENSTNGLKATLKLAGPAADAYGKDIDQLVVEVEYQTASRIHVHIYDAARTQFQVPESVFPRPSSSSISASDSELVFDHTPSPFAFWITRRSSGDVIFDTRSSPLVISDQFVHISTAIPGNTNIYGPGEVISPSGFRRDPAGASTTLWNRDAGTPVDENLYGAHAFHLETRYPDSTTSTSLGSASASHGIFLLNSHGMDVVQSPSSISYSILGGTLDFYVLAGPTQQDVVRQYAGVVGLPARQPFWAFGLHMCRWQGEWKTPEGVRGIVERMREAGVPLETVWSDLDYMNKIRNWDSNEDWAPKKYKAFLDYLHEHNQHYVPIIDAAIGIPDADDKTDTYFAYERGTELDVWIKDKDGKVYIGEVWPGKTVFPDWTHPKTQEWWEACFEKYREYAPADGIWLDMNEPASFQEGLERPDADLKNKLDFPPYEINSAFDYLWQKTVSPSAKLHDGSRHYNQHNFYGHAGNIATRKHLLKNAPEERPFIISRSTFAGTGRLSGHWLGDNYSTWASMKNSLQGVLQFQMFQIPMVGPDACGFSGNCPEELANRWMQLGAFYPFFRNHNVMDASPQEPFRWPAVAEASKKAIEVRYKLLPYWETLFAQASKDGTPPVRPLNWEFDDAKYAGVDAQILVGGSVLVTPCLTKGAREVKGFFPKAGGPWRDWWTHEAVHADANDEATIPLPLGSIGVHIRAGAVLLVHERAEYSLTDTKKGEYGLIVSLDERGGARGEAVLDDGMSLEGHETTVTFTATPEGLVIKGQGQYAAPRLGKITVLGLAGGGGGAKAVRVNGQEAAVEVQGEGVVVQANVDLAVESRVEW